MVKAEYFRTDRFDATGHTPWLEPEAPASAIPVVRTLPDSATAEELLAEIQRLYRQLDIWSGGRPTLEYLAIEAQIRDLAARHWHVTGGEAITQAGLSTQWAVPPAEPAAPRRYFRKVPGRPLISGQRHRLTRVW